jgi:hypothetical protein
VQQGFVVLQKPFDLAGLEQKLRETQRTKAEQTSAPSAVG